MEASDAELLKRYVQEGAEPAFRELVRRHIDLVFAVAWRRVRSRALAADITQSVFIDLARSARSLSPAQPLAAWLHVVANRTAVDAARAEQRRQIREQAAAELATANAAPSDWEKIEPLLDELLGTLDENDRQALLLRFFEDRSLREVGLALGTSDDAAQKRVSRALDHLRDAFVRRGVALTAAGLASQLPAAIVSAPSGLASSIPLAPVVALAAPASAASATKVLMATSLILAVGLVWEVRALATGRAHLNQSRTDASALGMETRQARHDRDLALAALQATRQRADVIRSRNAERLATETALAEWLARVASLHALLESTPAQGIPEMRYLKSKDWLAVTRENPLLTEMQKRRALGDLRRLAKSKPEIDRNFSQALKRFTAEHGGEWPAGADDLRPYLAPRLGDDILARYEVATLDPRFAASSASTGIRVLQERTAIDVDFDIQTSYLASGGSTNHPFFTESSLAAQLQKAYAGFRAANSQQWPTQPEQVMPYLPPTVDAATVRDFWQAVRLPFAQ